MQYKEVSRLGIQRANTRKCGGREVRGAIQGSLEVGKSEGQYKEVWGGEVRGAIQGSL